jgi:hypothetical protein
MALSRMPFGGLYWAPPKPLVPVAVGTAICGPPTSIDEVSGAPPHVPSVEAGGGAAVRPRATRSVARMAQPVGQPRRSIDPKVSSWR